MLSKFTPEGGSVSLAITEEYSIDERITLRFSVKDTGIGIPRDRQKAIFEPFSQADISTPSQFGGTGLGLAISSNLISLMGGELSLESAPQQGSCFEFTLSFATRNSIVPPEYNSGPYASIAGSISLEILLVEDNLINQKVAQKLLEKDGHQVTIAENGEEALLAYHSERFDVILMDIKMPVMDGFTASQKIRERETSGNHVNIIAMTANALEGHREKCLEAGMDDYISKPISRENLQRKLNRVAKKLKKPATHNLS